MWRRLLGAALAALCATPAYAGAWKAEKAPSRPGGVETCAVRWPDFGLALMSSRWPDGNVTDMLSVARANPGNTLELTLDSGERFLARAGDYRYWAQSALVEALLAGEKMRVAFMEGERGKMKPASGEVDLKSLKEAYEACRAALAAPSSEKANSR